MKLRDRKKPALINIKQEDQKPAALTKTQSTTITTAATDTDTFDLTIKQEDCKPETLTNAQFSAAIATDTNTFDLTIKQEDSKDHKVLLKQQGELDTRDFHYRCDICKQRLPNLKSVLEHRKSIHLDKKRWKPTRIKNIDVEPEVHDLDFYCKSCERGYIDKCAYRKHLRQAHFMILKPMSRWNAPKNNTVPDPNDPSFYCIACDFTYKHKNTYKQHCRFAHGLNPANFVNRTASTSSTMKNSYCQVCDKRLGSLASYRSHLFAIHKVDSRQIEQKRNDILPNVNDPNFYCRSCEKTLAHKKSFKQHLKRIHSIFESTPTKSKLKPDVHDPNNHCRACQNTYVSKASYRIHLRLVHRMTLTPLRGNVSREQLPDPYNPDHHCRVCKKTYASLTLYRVHCKRVHVMELNHASILNPSAEINANDPKLYCAQCENSFRDKSLFRQHLARVHSMY